MTSTQIRSPLGTDGLMQLCDSAGMRRRATWIAASRLFSSASFDPLLPGSLHLARPSAGARPRGPVCPSKKFLPRPPPGDGLTPRRRDLAGNQSGLTVDGMLNRPTPLTFFLSFFTMFVLKVWRRIWKLFLGFSRVLGFSLGCYFVSCYSELSWLESLAGRCVKLRICTWERGR